MTEMWGYLLVALLVLFVVLLKFKSDWRSYLVIAGALLSLIVARKDDIGRLVTLPDAVYTVCLIVGIVFLLAGLGLFVFHLFQPQQPQPPSPPQQQGLRPEISYAFDRTRAAWSWHHRVSLVLRRPSGRLIEEEPVHAFGNLVLTPAEGAEGTVIGRRIRALYSYEVVLENTGNQLFRNLPIQIELFKPNVLGLDASVGEEIIEKPSITAPPLARVECEQRPASLVGACDLLNPKERLNFGSTRTDQSSESLSRRCASACVLTTSHRLCSATGRPGTATPCDR